MSRLVKSSLSNTENIDWWEDIQFRFISNKVYLFSCYKYGSSVDRTITHLLFSRYIHMTFHYPYGSSVFPDSIPTHSQPLPLFVWYVQTDDDGCYHFHQRKLHPIHSWQSDNIVKEAPKVKHRPTHKNSKERKENQVWEISEHALLYKYPFNLLEFIQCLR